ncbi:type IVB secretion system protein IcmH/DotU [Endozoicomonas lisbonensis]|uniref:Type VI secretion system protein ImpK n=1 Tax=Endozoicomonas lisbonensis TaxID=3120522 RepID=A0ABV2SAR7_9GAMM
MTDKTVIIPTPGSRQPPATGTLPTESPPVQQPAHQPGMSPVGAAGSLPIRSSLNPVVSAASTLLTLMIKLRTTIEFSQAPNLHQLMVSHIQTFDRELQSAGLQPETTVAARYLMCTVLDETVMNTPWGAASGWSQRSLLSIFHRETFGGEKCFVMLQRLQETAAMNLDLLELFYLCLSQGFQGKFRLAANGPAQLETIRDNLYQVIQSHRQYADSELSPRWQGTGVRGKGLMQYIPVWVFATVAMAGLLAGYAGFSFWLFQGNAPVIELMQQLAGQ